MTKEYKVFPMPLKIRYKGLFDWGGLYRFVWNWLLKRQYRVHAKRYKDKVSTPLGNELEVDVWGEREVTEYYKYRIDVYYHLWESKDIPVIIEGKQVIRRGGRIHIELNAVITTDWQKRYRSDQNILQRLMENFLNDVVFKYDREMKHIDPLDKDLHNFESEIKKFLKIEAEESGVHHFV